MLSSDFASKMLSTESSFPFIGRITNDNYSISKPNYFLECQKLSQHYQHREFPNIQRKLSAQDDCLQCNLSLSKSDVYPQTEVFAQNQYFNVELDGYSLHNDKKRACEQNYSRDFDNPSLKCDLTFDSSEIPSQARSSTFLRKCDKATRNDLQIPSDEPSTTPANKTAETENIQKDMLQDETHQMDNSHFSNSHSSAFIEEFASAQLHDSLVISKDKEHKKENHKGSRIGIVSDEDVDGLSTILSESSSLSSSETASSAELSQLICSAPPTMSLWKYGTDVEIDVDGTKLSCVIEASRREMEDRWLQEDTALEKKLQDEMKGGRMQSVVFLREERGREEKEEEGNEPKERQREMSKAKQRLVKQQIAEAKIFERTFGEFVRKKWIVDKEEKQMWDRVEMKSRNKREEEEREIKEGRSHQLTLEEMKNLAIHSESVSGNKEVLEKLKKKIEEKERKIQAKQRLNEMSDLTRYFTVFSKDVKKMKQKMMKNPAKEEAEIEADARMHSKESIASIPAFPDLSVNSSGKKQFPQITIHYSTAAGVSSSDFNKNHRRFLFSESAVSNSMADSHLHSEFDFGIKKQYLNDIVQFPQKSNERSILTKEEAKEHIEKEMRGCSSIVKSSGIIAIQKNEPGFLNFDLNLLHFNPFPISKSQAISTTPIFEQYTNDSSPMLVALNKKRSDSKWEYSPLSADLTASDDECTETLDSAQLVTYLYFGIHPLSNNKTVKHQLRMKRQRNDLESYHKIKDAMIKRMLQRTSPQRKWMWCFDEGTRNYKKEWKNWFYGIMNRRKKALPSKTYVNNF
ncbi:uncharacterized protein MONOS_8804 [Monocercomonoides exilis]|uniref:uncharacterized protein n=1 Tax=Monocercomonoides exilis TaxID=2049356 RepID=UPI0035595198|nr:hypothetical protein MONOS_8804 [Monocercomonoides exilis]|eukprot:MONOS_8804.1-p1 / transcript=MONOS_8804.1 / gene=MONOS_8804 / organism=Monocercomonoides_exilis_PA203 / gene_product=unspecified product / transcript_product=unspecified product / location=Mono_scaffold00342:51984-54386(+) / protein_length=801 / sequence_SO=supercontig / SO=protein_coding / is_pseudo=false